MSIDDAVLQLQRINANLQEMVEQDIVTPIATPREVSVAAVGFEVIREVHRARELFPKPMNSPHEAYGTIKEELDEYWDEVKLFNLRKDRDTRPQRREELIQLAAMAIRAIVETIDEVKETVVETIDEVKET